MKNGTPLGGWPLRNIAILTLLLFAVIPTAMVGLLLHRSHLQSIDTLSGKIVGDVAHRVRKEMESQLALGNSLLNGIVEAEPTPSQIDRARAMLSDPEKFESMAHTLARMNPQTPFVFMGTAKGEYLGVQALPFSSQGFNRVGVQKANENRRQYFEAARAGDRSRPLPVQDAGTFDPRVRPWYAAAINERGRVTTPVYISASTKQLIITMAQPVFDQFGGSMGVFAVDLTLREINDMLRLISISRRGAAWIVDDAGYLVALSTGEELSRENNGQLIRMRPEESTNPVMRDVWSHVASRVGQREDSSVQRKRFSGSIDSPQGRLIVNMQDLSGGKGLPLTMIVAAPEDDFSAEVKESLKNSTYFMASIALIAAALGALLAWRLTQRFRALVQSAEQMGQGLLPERQDDARIREVRSLSAALHNSAREIIDNREALLQANEHLEERVALRTKQLEESREEALQAAKAKAAFLATMSHEIRTPLNGVVGMTTLMADTPLNEEQRDYLHTMRVSSDQLLAVINDILDFSKIESGKLDLENEPLSLQATVEEACDMGAPRAREKGLELIVDVGDEVPAWVRGDVTRLRQILLNFLGNAVKFTEAGQILVSVHLKEDFDAQRMLGGQTASGALVEFRVKDSGIGIPKDRQGALFQSFTQVDASTTRKYGGTGLGLAICKRLAELMQGEVGLESEPGEGSTFWFTARLNYSDAPDRTETSILELASLEGKLAVIVDDMPVNLQILNKQLKRWKMNVVSFDLAPKALEWLAVRDADVVLSDMHMPQMDGVMFATALHQIKPKMPVVLLTSGTLPDEQESRHFEGKLLKPYRQTQLFNILARILYVHADASTVPPAAPVALAPSLAHKGQIILVADDNAVNLKVAVSMLTKLGYEFVTVKDGQQAASSVAASLQAGGRAFAAVLMDANMPVMDGYASARAILAAHGKAAPPIIALTASVLEEDRQRCLEAGMIGFLPKPLRIDELSQSLEQYARMFSVDSQHSINLVADTVGLMPVNSSNHSQENVSTLLAPESSVLMDWSRLEQFKDFDDEERSMTREVISLFIQDAPMRRNDILASLGTTDAALLSLRAHALKGAASNVGAVALSSACSELEHACKSSGWPVDATQQINRINTLTDHTLAALKEWKLS